ncbi:alpha/beta fold hydrolase [Lentzea aerocolonigenes]|uniref:alpha/beta fold hydrolase n=1 Tax=Lentzea aerocolonigenes TaxID=68170 RepID=UPI0004C3676E|nr:alpha/beta hydrolase [Lentzea aerocolonigenes]MCP2243095.1 Pimeloyl-ACP methyl ester carboxylesterase [Lentzea aerocolonigenes]
MTTKTHVTRHRFADVDGIKIFYREAGDSDAPKLLLLHGFPSASHQYARLIEELKDDFHVIAPDNPGSGHSDAPQRQYSFDFLADTIEKFLETVGFTGFRMYVFDFGAPVGFRIATRHPEWINGLIVQNGNAYEDGLSELAKNFIANRDRRAARDMLALEYTKFGYLEGARDPETISPDTWTLDQHYLDLRPEPQVDLALDYHSNVAKYPEWQAYLREHQPPTLITWGTGDPFFIEPGAKAYLRDLPGAQLHLFDTGHFALEENLTEIAALIRDFTPTV